MKTFAELSELPTKEVLRRLDAAGSPPLHEGDAFLAVLVLQSVARLDASSRRFQLAGLFLALVAIGVAVAQLFS